jgi:phosphatidylglycerophosphate synthase
MSPVEIAALALGIAALATMPVFALRSRVRSVDADVARRPTTIFLGLWIRDWFMWILSPIERRLVHARVSPDVFNYLGVLFGAAAGIAFAFREPSLAAWMIVLGGVSDILDGRIARALGVASEYGAFVDSTFDRFAETFTFLGVAWFLASVPWGAVATAFALGGSLLVSFARARGEAHGVKFTGGIMQRAERLVLLALAAFLDPMVSSRAGWRSGSLLAATVGLIGLGALATAVYRTARTARELYRQDSRGR